MCIITIEHSSTIIVTLVQNCNEHLIFLKNLNRNYFTFKDKLLEDGQSKVTKYIFIQFM